MNRDVVESVAAFLGISCEELLERHDDYLQHQLARWHRLSPEGAAALADFYNDNLYLYELISTPSIGVVRLVEPFLRPGSAILDYGSGIGTHGFHFLRQGHRVTFADLPSPHFEYVRWQAARLDLAAEFVEAADAGALPGQTFDAVFCFDVLEHVVEWRETIRNLARLLKPDGKLFVIVSFREFEAHAIHIAARTGLTEESFGECMARSGLLEIFRRDRPAPLSHPLEPFRVFARAASASVSRISRLYEKGEAHLREGSMADAERCFAECLAWNPQDFAAHRELARSFLGQGRLAEAAAEVAQALALAPDDVGALELGADLQMKAGDAPGAARRYARAIATQIELADHSKRMLQSLLACGQSFEDVCGQFEDWRSLQTLLAYSIEVRRFGEAESLAARLTASHGPETYAGYLIWKEYARLLRETGRIAEAVEVLRRLLPLHRERLWLHYDLCLCHAAAGNIAAALAELDEEERRSPFRAGILFEKARLRLRQGDRSRAMDLLSQVLALQPEHSGAVLARGRLARELGDRALALADLRRATGLLPEDVEARFERAELEWAARHYGKALECFDAAYRLAPERVWPRLSPKMKLAVAARRLACRLRGA
jgi:tetratricopeptide (TPR) repeat protein